MMWQRDVCKTWTGVHGPPHGPGPWTRSMDKVPWTTPNFQKEIAQGCQFYMKIYRSSGYEKQRLLFIAYILEGLSRKNVLFWDRGAMNGKTTNSLWDTQDLLHFCPQYFHSNTFKLQFDREDTHPPPPPSIPRLLGSIVHKNEPIYFINEVYPRRTNLLSRYIDEKIRVCVFHTLTSGKFSS